MIKKGFALLFVLIFLTSCGEQTVTPPVNLNATVHAVVKETNVAGVSTQAPLPTYTLLPTYTPPATFTPLPTYTLPPTQTALPTYTPAPSATSEPQALNNDTPAPEANNTPVPQGGAPAGDWAVRSYNTDDLGVVFVNGKLVGASSHGQHADSGWITINDLLSPGGDTIVAFASWNRFGGRAWGFTVRRNDTGLWGSEEPHGDGPRALSYVQQVAIHPDGTVSAIPADTSVRTPPPGKWYVRVEKVDDVGTVLVNGMPVAAVHDNDDSDWVEITGQLYSDRDNIVTVASWNFDANFSWKISIRRDETILWSKEKTGSGSQGVVLQEDVTITSNGELIQP